MQVEELHLLSIVGPFSTVTGGAEVVKVRVADILVRLGYRVVLAGLSRNSFSKLESIVGYNVARTETYSLMPWFPQLLGLMQPLLGIRSVEKLVLRYDPDLVFIDVEGSKTLNRLWKAKGFKLVKYVNFPHSALLRVERDPGKFPEQYLADIRGYSRKYQSTFLWKTYWKTYLSVLERTLPRHPLEADILVVNSKYIAGLVKSLQNIEPPVVYPPVDISHLEPFASTPFEERENAVVMLGRLSSEKNFEEVIEAVSQTSTKPILRIIGAATTRGRSYMEFLGKLARERGVKIEFYPNLSRKELGKVLGSCRVFVHATRGEHFGIAVVEAMAAGLPVIVHRSGGQYTDIIEEGRFGLHYSTVEELAEKIDYILGNAASWRYYSELSKRRSKVFKPEVFERQLLSLLKARSIV